MPNALLARYFQGLGLLANLDFAVMNETQPAALFTAGLVLPDGQRNPVDAEFPDIFDMSCEKGSLAILDEAGWQCGQNRRRMKSLSRSSALANHYEQAMVESLIANQFMP
jgi:hypothetical protein